MTYCRGCDAPIIWAITAANQKRIPLDEKPEKRVVLETNPADPGGPQIARYVNVYMPHHATCPKVAEFRKPKARTSS